MQDNLIELITARSNEMERTRVSITLSAAVTVASNLTKEEFSVLSLCYVVKYTVCTCNYPIEFAQHFNKFIEPFLEGVSNHLSCYLHIEANSCGALGVTTRSAIELLRIAYGGMLSEGLTCETLKGVLLEHYEKYQIFFNPIANTCPCKYRLTIGAKEHFEALARGRQLPEDATARLWLAIEQSVPPAAEICRQFEATAPKLGKLFEFGLQHLSLTTVGIAIAQANARSRTAWPAPLSLSIA